MMRRYRSPSKQYGFSLDWFICPKCSNKLVKRAEGLYCINCLSNYPVANGIPLFALENLANTEAAERNFWEKEDRSNSEGGFHAFSDDSYRQIVRELNIPKGSFGLDFACGSGTFGKFLENRITVGLDISLTLLNISRGIIPVQGSGIKLPFADNLFDYAVCVAALHHMPTPAVALREIARVLCPGGILGIVELNTHHPQRKLVAYRKSPLRRLFPTTGFSPSEKLINDKDLQTWISTLDFRITKRVFLTLRFRNPSLFGKLQHLMSSILGHGILKPFIESYVLLRGIKNMNKIEN